MPADLPQIALEEYDVPVAGVCRAGCQYGDAGRSYRFSRHPACCRTSCAWSTATTGCAGIGGPGSEVGAGMPDAIVPIIR